MSRLKKIAIKKIAGTGWKNLDSFLIKSGDLISINVSFISNRPWFQVTHESDFNVSSYYDGSDYEVAKKYYTELLLAFKGVQSAEAFSKKSKNFQSLIDKFIKQETTYQGLKSQPLFLGMNNF